ncbi:MAG: beta-ketoacyl synthase N-terminal-like domain-containing protein [Mycobacterium sp.]
MHEHGIGITGIGVVSGYGWGREIFWEGLCSGKPAARYLDGCGDQEEDFAWLALVPEGGRPEDGEGLFGRAFLAAGREAVADAYEHGWNPGPNVGVIHVACFNDMYGWREFNRGNATRSRDFVRVFPSTPAAMLMKEFGFHGPSLMVSATCSSNNNAMLVAKLWMQTGVADDVMVVSADLSFTPEVVAGFTRMGASVIDADPLDACRPFQDGGRGFPPGEAAVGFVLSNRTITPYATLLGGAMTSDAYHPTGMDPTHNEVIRCVSEALTDAGVTPSDVQYFNAHGTGTDQCNDTETEVLTKIFGTEQPHIYALKPLIGHCLASAGAVELAAGAMAYERGVVPAARIVSRAHPRLLNGIAPFAGGVTLKTSMGMGGYNSAVVIGPPEAA